MSRVVLCGNSNFTGCNGSISRVAIETRREPLRIRALFAP